MASGLIIICATQISGHKPAEQASDFAGQAEQIDARTTPKS